MDQVQELPHDITDDSLGKKAVDLAVSRWGRLGGMVLNHGTLRSIDKVELQRKIQTTRTAVLRSTFSSASRWSVL